MQALQNHLKNVKLSSKSASILYKHPMFAQHVIIKHIQTDSAEWVSFRLASTRLPRNIRGSSAAPTQVTLLESLKQSNSSSNQKQQIQQLGFPGRFHFTYE